MGTEIQVKDWANKNGAALWYVWMPTEDERPLQEQHGNHIMLL